MARAKKLVFEGPDKRIVLRQMTGARAGLWSIQGTLSQLMAANKRLPGRIDNVDFGDHSGTAVHSGDKPRYILYQEYANVDGKMPDINPAQR